MHELVRSFAGKRVLVVGDVILDEYIWGEVRRISPEAPVPVVEMQRRTYVPGGAANAAGNVVSLGGQALLGGVVGPDHAAGQLRRALRHGGVDADGLVEDPERQTTCKTRIVAHNQQVVRVDCEQRAALPAPVENKLLAWVEATVPAVDACILSDYGKGVVSPRLAGHVLRLARQAGRPVIVDPKGTDYAKYRGATLIKPNLPEAERVLRREIHSDAEFLSAGRQLLEVLDSSAVLITRGARGMTLFREGSPPLHVPSVAREVFDVTGAGDTVVSTLALALAANVSLDQAADLANRAAGVAVSKLGTSAVTFHELLESASRSNPSLPSGDDSDC
jgi:D-beta-D-heptose 7-phosphate kinase/D-beta-D-heptose 1-phosphate adenosyltransferase